MCMSQDAQIEYRARRAELSELLKELLLSAESQPEPAKLNWGHVGDVGHLLSLARQLKDSMYGGQDQ